MISLETTAKVRRDLFVHGKSIKEISRERGISRNAARKILRSGETTFHYERPATPMPKLGAVFFHLYGVFDPADRARSRDDVAYVFSTFPIVERQETETHGRYLSRDLCLAYCNTVAAGQPDTEPSP